MGHGTLLVTYTEAYAKSDDRPLRNAFFCATDRGDLEWDDSGVTEAKVSVYMAAEGHTCPIL